jgi:hypothetical protein
LREAVMNPQPRHSLALPMIVQITLACLTRSCLCRSQLERRPIDLLKTLSSLSGGCVIAVGGDGPA